MSATEDYLAKHAIEERLSATNNDKRFVIQSIIMIIMIMTTMLLLIILLIVVIVQITDNTTIEERLSQAVKALLNEQPEDPTEFLCRLSLSLL